MRGKKEKNVNPYLSRSDEELLNQRSVILHAARVVEEKNARKERFTRAHRKVVKKIFATAESVARELKRRGYWVFLESMICFSCHY